MELREQKRNAARIIVHDPERVPCTFRHRGLQFSGHVYDFSRHGLSVRLGITATPPAEDETIEGLHIDAYGHAQELGPGTVVRILEADQFRYVGVHLVEEFPDLTFLADRNKVYLQEDERRSLAFYLKYLELATPEIKGFSAELAYGLGTYRRALDDLDTKFAREPLELRELLFESIRDGIGQQLKEYMDKMLLRLEELIKGYSKRQHEQNGFFLRRIIWPYILESDFLKRTNIKPRGYAGDSAMMEMCYENDYVGTSSFGRIMHKHPIETDAAEAVRARRRLINEEINRYIEETGSEEFKIISIACGPAWEMGDFLSESPNRHRVRLVLLDQDTEALTEARERIEAIQTDRPFRVEYLQDSVRTLLRTADPAGKYGRFDFVYSMGLFDYLTEPVARAVLSKLYAMTADGGKLIVGNYHKSNPTRVYMEYLMDWILFYRSEDGFLALTDQLPGKFEAKIGFDPTGSQMFLNLTRA